MYKIYILLICSSIFWGCKKDGLSRKTGNIEITIINCDNVSIKLYTEYQFNNYLNSKPSVTYRELGDGTTITKIENNTYTCTLKEIPAGVYGCKLYYYDKRYNQYKIINKSIVVINNKTVKESFGR